jgi:hypothetical protein
MRHVLSVSMPGEMVSHITKKAKKLGLSISAYMQRLVMHDELLISEDELLEDIRITERERRAGKLHLLRSIDDLDKA